MVRVLKIIFSFLVTFNLKSQVPQVCELIVKDNNYVINEHHETGVFLIGFEPIFYKKKFNLISLKGVISYANQEKYSAKFDTLIKGISGVKIYLAKYNDIKKSFQILKLLGKGDCNGVFDIKFPNKIDKYLIFIGEGKTTTAFNTILYFKKFDNKVENKLNLKSLCK